MDFVFTVCGNAANEPCPRWPGQPMTAQREEQVRAFQRALRELDARIQLFVSLPFEHLDRMALQRKLREMGGTEA
jgi:hypothetical protein